MGWLRPYPYPAGAIPRMKGYIKTSRIETILKALSSVTKSIPQASMKTKVPLV